MSDEYDLSRFVTAQEAGGTYQQAVIELRQGRKVSHWMWFVFPQLAGLGRSATARQFAISSLDEARAYLGHQVLGPRLLECSQALAAVKERSAAEVLGVVDAAKLRSSMTLFQQADPQQAVFGQVLSDFYGGQPDPVTLELLRS